jgi:hypothetical protein
MKELVVSQLMFGAQAGLTQRVSQTGIDSQPLVIPVFTEIHVVPKNMEFGMLAIDRSGVATLTLTVTQCNIHVHVHICTVAHVFAGHT